MQAVEQRTAKQPEASTSVSNMALQAMQTDLQHQVCPYPFLNTDTLLSALKLPVVCHVRSPYTGSFESLDSFSCSRKRQQAP